MLSYSWSLGPALGRDGPRVFPRRQTLSTSAIDSAFPALDLSLSVFKGLPRP